MLLNESAEFLRMCRRKTWLNRRRHEHHRPARTRHPDRVIALFRDELGYRYLGDWTDRNGNSNIEEKLLSAWLTKSGYTPAQISAALYKLRTEADNHNRNALRQQPGRL